MATEDGRLTAVVNDDGIGFEPPVDGNHFGLATMQERAASVGGELQIDSNPIQGTQITLYLPLMDGNGSSLAVETLSVPVSFRAAHPSAEERGRLK